MVKFTKYLIIICFMCLSVNSYSQDVTKIIVVNKPIKYVYRVVIESLNKCDDFVAGLTYVGAYYDDNDTASIYIAGNQLGLGDSFKLRKISEDSTEISYYKAQCLICSMAMAEMKLEKILKWIKDGDRECKKIAAPSNQTFIK